MILVVGGRGSGKRAYVRALGYGDADVSADAAGDAFVTVDAHEIVRAGDCDVEGLAAWLAEHRSVITCSEVGSGIVPIDPEERAWRDRVGLLCQLLAKRARAVVRMVCGIPTAVKGRLPYTDGPVRVVIMRHGSTTANEAHEYAGSRDVSLTPKGEEQAEAAGVCPQVDYVYVSPLKRARRTADICFPGARQIQVANLREMNFGVFEGRSADDMEHDPAYRAWVEGFCEDRCPGGECRAELSERVAAGMHEVVRDAMAEGRRTAIVVAHGGTIMAAMDALADDERGYFEWQVGNCQGYCAEAVFENGHLHLCSVELIRDLGFIGDEYSSQSETRYPAHLFFSNKACKYFPCHEGVDERDFNCMFCYCPLYALGPDCGGNYTYTESGRKNCTGCVLPHLRDAGAKLVASRYSKLADLAAI